MGAPTMQRQSASTRNQVAASFLGGALVITLLLLLAPRERCRGAGECSSCQPLGKLRPPLQPQQLPHSGRRAPPLPWPPLLSPSQLRRGLGYYGSGERVERVAAALQAGRPITAVVVGGSISKGAGSSRPDRAFPARFFEYLNASWPHPGHTFLNKAVGGTTSGLFATCAEALVPPDTDLVVVEFTFNEPGDAPFTWPHRRGFEQMLRKLARLPRAPAVLVLHHYAWWFAAGDGVDAGLFYRPAEAQLSTLAQYYDMPSPSLRNALHSAMAADRPPFKVSRVHKEGVVSPGGVALKPAPKGPRSRAYMFVDAIHPTDTGHQVLAELLAGVMQTAASNVAEAAAAGEGPLAELLRSGGDGRSSDSSSSSSSESDGSSSADGDDDSSSSKQQEGAEVKLPPPMIPGNAAHATSLCAMQEAFKELAAEADGFEWRPERPDASDFVSQKWGWRGERQGAWLELLLSTQEAPGKRGKASVVLGFLSSYEGMGLARVECRSGCTCAPSLVDGLWSERTSLMQLHSFKASQHPRCRLRVTIVPRPAGRRAPPGAGSKFQLSAAMVAHAPLPLNFYHRQAADVQKLADR